MAGGFILPVRICFLPNISGQLDSHLIEQERRDQINAFEMRQRLIKQLLGNTDAFGSAGFAFQTGHPFADLVRQLDAGHFIMQIFGIAAACKRHNPQKNRDG